MLVEFVPGLGEDCSPAHPIKVRPNEALHLHCDAKGALFAYRGAAFTCPDARKARTLASLQREKIV